MARLTDLLKNGGEIERESRTHGHDGFFPNVVTVVGPEGKSVVRGQSNPTPSVSAERGRILLFAPTGERVTILKEKVGQSYKGDWLHEVTTREGHRFLALQKQLKEPVK